MDKVSVIIPVYNVEPYVRQCLESVINQTYSNLEIIIVDDGSTDNCGKICDLYAEQYNCVAVYHKKNGGLSSARNMGLNYATGEWILFVDSDDWCEVDYIEKMIGLKSNSMIDVIISSSVHELSNGRKYIHQLMRDEGIYDDNNILNIVWGKSLCITFKNEYNYGINKNSTNSAPWDKLYRRKIISENDLRYDEKLKVHEDRLFNLKYFEYVKHFKYVDTQGYNYRFVKQSITKKYDIDRVNKEKYFAELIFDYYIKNEKKNVFLEMAICLGALQIFNGIRNNLSVFAINKEKEEKKKLFLEVTDWKIMQKTCKFLKINDISEVKYKLIYITLKYKSYFLLLNGTRLFRKR